jgi:hypothetical protein
MKNHTPDCPRVDCKCPQMEGASIISIQNRYIPEGSELVEAYETEKEIIVCGQPEDEPEEHDDSWYETAHNCDQMGCGTWSHVIYRFDKQPPVTAKASDEGEIAPIDMLLYCPRCATQHVDEAKPDVCETCGHKKEKHSKTGCDWSRERGGGMSGKLRSIEFCHCERFTAWLNPPHKSHRCTACNHVWRPADVATNGVKDLESQGARDGSPQPMKAENVQALVDALRSVVKIADEAAQEWDSDNDMRVGKILAALCGRLPHYRADIDAIHAALKPFQKGGAK